MFQNTPKNYSNRQTQDREALIKFISTEVAARAAVLVAAKNAANNTGIPNKYYH